MLWASVHFGMTSLRLFQEALEGFILSKEGFIIFLARRGKVALYNLLVTWLS